MERTNLRCFSPEMTRSPHDTVEVTGVPSTSTIQSPIKQVADAILI